MSLFNDDRFVPIDGCHPDLQARVDAFNERMLQYKNDIDSLERIAASGTEIMPNAKELLDKVKQARRDCIDATNASQARAERRESEARKESGVVEEAAPQGELNRQE